jgi:predicted ArsR family transcriptional regulator
MDSIVHGVARRMASNAREPLPGEPMPERLTRVVDFLNRQGYVARWETDDQGFLLHTSNCPYQGLTERHTAPCIMDTALLTELLGSQPLRISWMRAGDDTCTYLVKNSH